MGWRGGRPVISPRDRVKSRRSPAILSDLLTALATAAAWVGWGLLLFLVAD